MIIFLNKNSLLAPTEPFIALTEMSPPCNYNFAMDDTEGVCDLYDDDDEQEAEGDNNDTSPMPCV